MKCAYINLLYRIEMADVVHFSYLRRKIWFFFWQIRCAIVRIQSYSPSLSSICLSLVCLYFRHYAIPWNTVWHRIASTSGERCSSICYCCIVHLPQNRYKSTFNGNAAVSSIEPYVLILIKDSNPLEGNTRKTSGPSAERRYFFMYAPASAHRVR